MSRQVPEPVELEQERRRLIDELLADHGPTWAEEYKPGSFGCHELLDRTALLADTVERYVVSHPACVQKKEWFGLANKALAALHELYQRIGEHHLDDGE